MKDSGIEKIEEKIKEKEVRIDKRRAHIERVAGISDMLPKPKGWLWFRKRCPHCNSVLHKEIWRYENREATYFLCRNGDCGYEYAILIVHYGMFPG